MKAINPLAQLSGHQALIQAARHPQAFARGKVPSLTDGIIRGPGGPTEDKVDAKVSPQEAILPARTVQAIGGPAAVKALIERTNGGMPPESEVMDNGKYADGAVPGFFDDVRNAMASGAPIKQDVADVTKLATDTVAQASRPADALVSGVIDSGRQIGRASQQAIGDFSDKSRLMPDIPEADQATYAAQPKPQNALAAPLQPAAATSAPKPLVQAIAAPTVQTGQPLSRLPSPGADTQVGTQGQQMANLTAGYDDSVRQLANIRALSDEATKPERLATNGTNWGADERARKQDFNNFVSQSTMESGLRDAVRSGKATNVQAAGNALSQFAKVADAPAQAEAERTNKLALLDSKSLSDAALSDRRNATTLLDTALRGRNALAEVALRGQNDLAAKQYVHPLDAEGKRLSNQQAMANLSNSDTMQVMQTRLLAAKTDPERQDIADQMMTLQGKEPRNRYDVTMGRGTKTKNLDGSESFVEDVPYAFNRQTGEVVRQNQGQLAKSAQPAAPTFEQYAEQIRARNRGQQLSDKQLQDAYSQRYGQ